MDVGMCVGVRGGGRGWGTRGDMFSAVIICINVCLFCLFLFLNPMFLLLLLLLLNDFRSCSVLFTCFFIFLNQ